MKCIILTTESNSDISKESNSWHNVRVVLMHIVMNGVDYLEGRLPAKNIFKFYEQTKNSHLQQLRIHMSIMFF